VKWKLEIAYKLQSQRMSVALIEQITGTFSGTMAVSQAEFVAQHFTAFIIFGFKTIFW